MNTLTSLYVTECLWCTVDGEVVFIQRVVCGISDVTQSDAVLSDWTTVLTENTNMFVSSASRTRRETTSGHNIQCEVCIVSLDGFGYRGAAGTVVMVTHSFVRQQVFVSVDHVLHVT